MSDNKQINEPYHSVRFHGKGGEYFVIWLVNVLLTIITLGIYSAWATVRRRRYFLGNTEINGERFDYHAKPMQILKGRLLVVAGIIVFYILVALIPKLALVFALVFLAMLPWVIIRSWRYNAIMTSYRGIRFNYHCKVGRAYWAMYLCPILLLLALYLPVAVVVFVVAQIGSVSAVILGFLILVVGLILGIAAVQGIISAMQNNLFVNNMFFGNAPFQATLKKKVFIKYSLLGLLLFVPFLIATFWLMGSFIVTMYQIAMLGDISADTTNAIMMMYLFNFFMAMVILFIGALVAASYQVAAIRNYIFNQTKIDGHVQLHSSMKTLPYLWLLFTNSLIVIFSLGLATPVAHVRYARYIANCTAVEGDLSRLNVQAHHETTNSAVAEEIAQMLDPGVGI